MKPTPTSTLRGSGIAWVVPLVLGLAGAMALAQPSPRSEPETRTTRPAGARKPNAAGSRGVSLPDSVLARIASRRLVTVSGFHTAWRQVDPPGRPDSLTPAGVRKFLDLLVSKEALAEVALGESFVWTARESAEYRALADGLSMRAAYDSALAELRGRIARSGQPVPDSTALGLAARESTAVGLAVRFDTSAVGRLARAFAALPKPSPDSGLFAQFRIMAMVPELSPEDLARTLVQTRRGPYTTGEWMATWSALSPIYRPRLEYPDEVEAVTKNQLYEREIRLEAERRRIAEWPQIAAILERKREYFAVTHLVGREVYDHIATDSVTLHRYYVANKSFWDLPLRVALTRLTLPDLQAARKMAVTLSDGVSAESLVSLAARSGVRYNAEITADSDSVLFDRAMRARPGSVLGPDQVKGGWEVVRVIAVEPPRSRTFAECRILVGQRWYGEEGERRMLELLTRCRKQVRVVENPRAVTLLTSP